MTVGSWLARRLPRHSLAALALISAIVCGSVAAKGAVVQRSMADQELARCIGIAADGRPWLEKTLWGLRDQEGGWIGAAVLNINGSYDLGPLQVNSWWVPRIAALSDRPQAHVRWWLTYDACFNVNAARWIFLSALAVTRDYWKAIGLYHSPTNWRQRRYATEVAAKLKQRFGSDVFSR